MENESSNLFLILIKLKSYLLSLIDQTDDTAMNFNYTEEYLERRCPERKEDIITLLKDNNINTDYDIITDSTIHEKFHKITSSGSIDLGRVLKDLDIEAKSLTSENDYKIERAKRINIILKSLYQLAQNWAARKELEEDVDAYSMLDEENMIRPNEEQNLNKLDSYASLSFMNISLITQKYIELLTDYYFEYGGDIALQEFMNDLDLIRGGVMNKYSDLFRKHGLDPNLLKRSST